MRAEIHLRVPRVSVIVRYVHERLWRLRPCSSSVFVWWNVMLPDSSVSYRAHVKVRETGRRGVSSWKTKW